MTKEDDSFKAINGPWKVIAYIFRYRMKEMLAILVVLLIGYIMVANVSYDKKNGFSWQPSVSIEVKK